METHSLKDLIKDLVEIEPNKSPVVSCFATINKAGDTRFTDPEFSRLSQRLAGEWREELENIHEQVRLYLENSIQSETESVAIYGRAGNQPFFKAQQFNVPLESDMILDKIPHIYPLIELKDNYHRFVIVITTETEAKILETTIGSVTEEILAKRPELRQRIGREWTREHYRNHKHEREQQFIKEKIKILEDLMRRKGHNHLIIAGSPKMVSRVSNALPSHLKDRLITRMSSNPASGLKPLLKNCILEFSAAENLEGHDRVALLESSVLSNGLGVTGFEACQEAIVGGYADMLIIDQEYSNRADREELVRLATTSNIEIEVVQGSETLARLEGVGCLLRFKPYIHSLDEEETYS